MTREEKDVIRLYYADTSNVELADMIGRSINTVKAFARVNRLHKSPKYRRQTNWENIMIARGAMRRKGVCPADARRQYVDVHRDLPQIAERWMNGESSLSLSREYCVPRATLVTLLNRKGYKKKGK